MSGVVALAVATLPATIHPAAGYVSCLAEAARRLRGRDVDDSDVLALSLHLSAPVWSNDHDFDGTGVDVYTTARLLKALRA
ncbi:MAG: PIN domain-containing protein [Planctomycetota bacterium]